jgi:Uma2 family endonuclease
MVTLQLRQMVVTPGQHIQFQDVDWVEFEAIVAELGEKRGSRIAYFDRMLEIRMPLPEHELDKELIGDLVKLLIDELDHDCACYGSTTFKRKNLGVGVEPDQCFYIENVAKMVGKRQLDLTIDPPPDLAIEVDVTSRTGLEVYQRLGVPEVWRFEKGELRISLLQNGEYQDSIVSAQFPSFVTASIISEMVKLGTIESRKVVLRTFRTWIRSMIESEYGF